MFLQFLEVGDRHGAEIIQSSYVTCLVHLAELCGLISGLEPNLKSRMDNICDSSLERLGYLTRGMRADGYTCLDVLLGVYPCTTCSDGERLMRPASWRRSLKVFGSGEGASLRNHQEIVAAAWTDFEARLLDTEVFPDALCAPDVRRWSGAGIKVRIPKPHALLLSSKNPGWLVSEKRTWKVLQSLGSTNTVRVLGCCSLGPETRVSPGLPWASSSHQNISGRILVSGNHFMRLSPPPGYPSGGPTIRILSIFFIPHTNIPV